MMFDALKCDREAAFVPDLSVSRELESRAASFNGLKGYILRRTVRESTARLPGAS